MVADGSAIYPSELLEPTPRYDTGVFFASGQDPVRKDVLEMLLRLFDREDLQLIPAVELAAPLPALEALRRRGPAGAAGTGMDRAGRRDLDARPTPPAAAWPPTTTCWIRACRTRCWRWCGSWSSATRRHPSFAGLALRLSADGYAQLPGPEWGMDDATIARFEHDTNLQRARRGPAALRRPRAPSS